MGKRRALDRQIQMHLVDESIYASAKDCAATSAALGVVLVVCPWMAFPLSLLGVFGAAKATMDLVEAFWDDLTEEHKAKCDLLSTRMA